MTSLTNAVFKQYLAVTPSAHQALKTGIYGALSVQSALMLDNRITAFERADTARRSRTTERSDKVRIIV